MSAPPIISQSIVLPLPPSANRYWRAFRGRTVVSADAKAYKHDVWLVGQHAYRARKAGDLDNMQKVLLDSLTGIAYNDDAQIVELHSWRHDDKGNPRVEVEIRQVQE